MNSPSTPKFSVVPIRRVTSNLDHLRIPLNALERAERPGSVPYWGANSVVDHVDTPLVDGKMILIGEDGAPFFDKDRPVAFSLNEPIWPNNHVHVLRATGNNDHRFISYALNAVDYRLYIKGSTRDKLNQADLSSINIPLPAPSVQRRIADYLDHETAEIDAFTTELNDLKSLLLIRRRTTIDDAFESTGAPTVALKYLGELNSGLTLGKKYEGPTQEYPYLRVANVQAGLVDLKNITTVSVPQTVAAKSLLRAGDVLMTEGGDRDKLGRGALWQGEIDPILHQNHIFSFRCNSKLLPEYLVYGLESTPARIYFDHTARQSTNLASTNSAIVKNFRLPAPSVGTQEKVLDHLHHELTEMQEMLSNADRVIDLARERRAALITAAVTGQIDVSAKNKPVAEQLEDDIAQGLHKES